MAVPEPQSDFDRELSAEITASEQMRVAVLLGQVSIKGYSSAVSVWQLA